MDTIEQIYPLIFRQLSESEEQERTEWEEAHEGGPPWPGEAMHGIVRLNPKLRKGGYLELITGADPIYLFKGALDRFEALLGSGDNGVIAEPGKETASFDLAHLSSAAPPAVMKVNPDLGEITLFCVESAVRGYIRIVEFCH